MKRLVFAAALSFAAFAFADTVSGTDTYGVLKIADTDNATVVVCVPWIGVDNSAIKVSDLIMTSNRKAGDVLYYYDKTAGNYKAWILNSDGGTWQAVNSVTGSGVTIGENPGTQAAVRGDALIIVRQPSTEGGSTYPEVYLYGKYSNADVTTAITAPGEGVAQVFNLIAPPNGTSDCDMNASGRHTDGTINPKDRIILNNDPHQYRYVTAEAGWGYYDLTDPTNPSFEKRLTIPAGEGAWYISKGGNPTFTW